MFENEAKGWYGSYSRIGKGYAERFYIISHKDEIFGRENKKIRIKDFFNPDEIKQKPDLEETLDVFKLYTSNKKTKVKILKSLLKPKKSFLDYKLHRKKLFKKNKTGKISNTADSKYGSENNQPACTRYNPNYNYIKPKLLEGPLWKDIPGRNQKGLNPNEDKIFTAQIEDNQNYKYYVLENEKSKCLVNMNKTTQRGEFSDIKDLRIRTDKPFIKPKKTYKTNKKNNIKSKINSKNNSTNINNNNIRKKNERNKSHRIVNIYKNINTMLSEPRDLLEEQIQNLNQDKDFKEKRKKRISKTILKEIGFYNDNNNNEKKDELIKNKISKKKDELIKNKISKKILNIKSSSSFSKKVSIECNSLTERTNLSLENKKNQNNNKKKEYKAPDFNKIISREQVEKARGKKHYMFPFITPNYTLISERSLTMTDYDKSKYKPNKRNKQYKGLDYSFKYKPDELINKYNNHIEPKVPNFNYMTSRPNKKNCPLPTYMQNVHDRLSVYNLNDKSLLLNNYSNREISPAITTFFPKKSFNNIINYNIINWKKNIKNRKDEDEDFEKKLELLKLQVNYEPEKCEQLKKEGTINKFDKITLKTQENQNINEIKAQKKNFLII